MTTFKFQIPRWPNPDCPALIFNVSGENFLDARTKAEQLLRENADADGTLHLDLTYGLEGTRLKIPETLWAPALLLAEEPMDQPF